jgi:hypothetical protein
MLIDEGAKCLVADVRACDVRDYLAQIEGKASFSSYLKEMWNGI